MGSELLQPSLGLGTRPEITQGNFGPRNPGLNDGIPVGMSVGQMLKAKC